MSTDPCRFEDDAKMGRTHTRRAWCVFVLFFIGLLGFIVSLYIVDGPAPDDSAMLPHFTEGGGENNALAVFLQKIDGAAAIAVTESPYGSSEELLKQPKEKHDQYLIDNVRILKALDELFCSRTESWRYNLKNKLTESELPDRSSIYQFIQSLRVYHFRVLLDLKYENHDEVIAQCEKLLNAANGIESSESVTTCWLISDMMRNFALDALAQSAVRQGSKGDILQRIKKTIEAEVNSNHWMVDFLHALQTDYLFFKYGIAYLERHPVEMSQVIRLHPAKALWFTHENKTLKLALELQKPVVQALSKGSSIKNVANEFSDRNQVFDSIKFSKWKRLRPNSAGVYMALSYFGDDQKHFINRVEAQAKIEVLYTMLAIRIYELTHHKLPDKLEELTPEFMLPSFRSSQNFEELRWSKEDMKIYRKNMINAAHHRDPVIKTEFDYLWESHNAR